MTVSPFDSAIHGALISDDEIAALFSDDAQIRAMLSVEVALARAQAETGTVPPDAAERIAAAADSLTVSPARLAAGTASAGVPVSALVSALREAAGAAAGQHVHKGATSQDIVDTALVLRLRDALSLLSVRLDTLIRTLARQADTHRDTVMAARTRWQRATPTTLGLKVAGWVAPLIRHCDRLAELRPRLLTIQLGGAAGTLAAFGPSGLDVADSLARQLTLGAPPSPWHTQRDTLVELAGWLSLVTGTIGKMGSDLVLLAQSEVDEVRAGRGGGSSTMPQKANPVAAEILITLARWNAGCVATMHQAALQPHERDGAGWTLEWLTLPQMLVATGAALRHGFALAETMTADETRMRAHLEADGGVLLAEAAVFALLPHMTRREAETLVTEACAAVLEQGGHFVDLLAARTDAPVDWATLREPGAYTGLAQALVDRVLAETARGT